MADEKELRVHVTSNGGVYVDANELLRSEAVRKAIEQAKRDPQAILPPGTVISTREESDKAT